MKFVWNSVIEDILGENAVTGIKIKNVKTQKVSELECEGVFMAIGHTPNTELFSSYLKLHENKYMETHPNSTKTSIDGIFAAGDVQDFVFRQAITAAGSGCMAAIECEKYLESLHS